MSSPDVYTHGAPGDNLAEQDYRQHPLVSLGGPYHSGGPSPNFAYRHAEHDLPGYFEAIVRDGIAAAASDETEYTPGELPEGMKIVAAGSAEQAGTAARLSSHCAARTLFDASRGVGSITHGFSENGGSRALIAETYNRSHVQSVATNNAEPQERTVTWAARTADVAYGEVEAIAEEEGYDVRATAASTAFQLVGNNELVYANHGQAPIDTRLYIVGPNGECYQLTTDQQNEVQRIALAPYGRTTLILASAGLTTPEEIEAAMQAEPDPNELGAAEALAHRLVAQRPDLEDDGAALVVTIETGSTEPELPIPPPIMPARPEPAPSSGPKHAKSKDRPAAALQTSAIAPQPEPAEKWEDTRSRWRQRLDKIRPSTLVYLALAKWQTRDRRQLYESDSNKAVIGRIAARSGDLALAYAVGRTVWTIGHSILSAKGWIGPDSGLDINMPRLRIPRATMAPVELLAHQKTADTPLLQLPAEIVPDTTPVIDETKGTTAPARATDTELLLEPASKSRTAHSLDTTTGRGEQSRASNVTDWSRQALYDSLINAGVPADKATRLSNDQKLLNQVNAAFFNDNRTQALHANRSYNVTGQLQTAADIAQGYAPAPPQPAPNPGTEVPVVPGPGPIAPPDAPPASGSQPIDRPKFELFTPISQAEAFAVSDAIGLIAITRELTQNYPYDPNQDKKKKTDRPQNRRSHRGRHHTSKRGPSSKSSSTRPVSRVS